MKHWKRLTCMVLFLCCCLALPSCTLGENATDIPLALFRELFPSATLEEGAFEEDAFKEDAFKEDDYSCLRAILVDERGVRRFACAAKTPEGWNTMLSTPLPQNAHMTQEQYMRGYLVVNGIYLFIAPDAEQVWGVRNAASYGEGGLIDEWLWCGVDCFMVDAHRLFCSMPYRDIRTIDWDTVTNSPTELLSVCDWGAWGCVNAPFGTAALRTSAAEDGVVLGNYLSGAPVQTLLKGNEWCKVSICGQVGWMQTEELALGLEQMKVKKEIEPMYLDVGKEQVYLYEQPDEGAPRVDLRSEVVLYSSDTLYAIGSIGEGWLHVWTDDYGRSGYMHEDDIQPGNS